MCSSNMGDGNFTHGLMGFYGGLMAFTGGLIGSNGNFNGIWLVVYLPLWKIMEFVSWDDDIPNIWKNNPNVPNHQPVFIGLGL